MTETHRPPYLRIAEALKQRMANGDLRQGDRLPSTRQIARDWKVALATATKALTVLRHEGLIEARARSGTVVAVSSSGSATQRRHSPTPPDHDLSQERVVLAAIEIADSEGLAALSMRSVAARLGVAKMSLYRCVSNKEELILLMADAAYGEACPDEQASLGWRPQLELSARALWALYVKHSWLAHISALTRPLLLPNLMRHAEIVLRVLSDHQLDPSTTMHLHVLLYNYVHGIAIHLERKAHAEALTGLSDDAWMETQGAALFSLVASGRYPAFTRLVESFEQGYDLQLSELFEFGLRTLLDGFTVIIERQSGSPTPG